MSASNSGELQRTTTACGGHEVAPLDILELEFAGARQHLCDIEKGRRQVSVKRAAEFARLLGYSEHQFVALALDDQIKSAGLTMKVKIEAA